MRTRWFGSGYSKIVCQKIALQTIIGPYNQIFVSPINLWEMSIKYHKGKWDETKLVIRDF